ncbi:SoxR reducing system RseC family protein [Litoribrevibacter euphylliae]|uniref:SoxR reducing system RseC family protein n=1 Tax=Litoribrevibacter euphylliae TaxID=1834034 RepID=A0ABV7HDF7_9GAMM
MVEESGLIVAVEDDRVWVETIRSSACDSCKAQKGCGHGLINKATSGQRFRLDVQRNGIAAKVGDTALIGIPEDSILKASLIGYLLPIVLLLLFSGTAKLLWGELPSILSGLLGLGLGFFLVRYLGNSERLGGGPQLLRVNPSFDS